MSIYAFHENAAPVTALTGPEILPVNQSGVVKQVLASQLQAFNGKQKLLNVGPANLGALTGIDTNGRALTADTTYFSDVFIPYSCILTGAAVLNGTTVGTNKGFVMLFNNAGTLVANSAVTSGGATTSGASTFQERAFVSAYTVTNPGRYWIGFQMNGNTDTVRTIVAATWVDTSTGSVAGANAVATTSITPTDTFTANVGIVSYVYR